MIKFLGTIKQKIKFNKKVGNFMNNYELLKKIKQIVNNCGKKNGI